MAVTFGELIEQILEDGSMVAEIETIVFGKKKEFDCQYELL